MQLIQFLLIAGVLIAVVLAARFLPGDRSLAIKRIVAIVFAACAVLAILFPQVLTRVASFFGVGRGTDLLLYFFVLMTLWFAVATIRAKARSDARVTDLARAVALMEARADDSTDPKDTQP